MEQSFSQRMGLKPVKNIIQDSSIDDDLRISLWNDFYTKFGLLVLLLVGLIFSHLSTTYGYITLSML